MLSARNARDAASRGCSALVDVACHIARGKPTDAADAASQALGEALSLVTVLAREGATPINGRDLAERLRRVAELVEPREQEARRAG